MKIDFSFLTKKDILVYDGVSLPILNKVFANNNFNVYFNRWEKINFWIFITTLLEFKFRSFSELKKNYKINYISTCSPKIIITFIDNNPAFYELKNIYPNAKTISIQNGVRKSNDLKIFKDKNKYFCDYFFTFSSSHEKFFSKFIKAKYIDAGSIKMNEYKIRKFKKKKDILFISQNATHDLKLENVEKFLIKNLIKICSNNELILNILCKKHIKAKILKEFKEIKYKNVFESDAKFVPYEIIQKYELKVFVDSTLGLECLGIGEKAFAIPLGCKPSHKKKFKIKKRVDKFGFPLKLKEQGYCWSNEFDYSKVKNKILKLINLKKSEWNRIHNLKKVLMSYDENNRRLKKIIKKYRSN